jgi:hypothetical protein
MTITKRRITMFDIIAGRKSPPLFPSQPSFAEYDRLKKNRGGQGLNDFTPTDGYDDLSAMGLMKMFVMSPLSGILKKK